MADEIRSEDLGHGTRPAGGRGCGRPFPPIHCSRRKLPRAPEPHRSAVFVRTGETIPTRLCGRRPGHQAIGPCRIALAIMGDLHRARALNTATSPKGPRCRAPPCQTSKPWFFDERSLLRRYLPLTLLRITFLTGCGVCGRRCQLSLIETIDSHVSARERWKRRLLRVALVQVPIGRTLWTPSPRSPPKRRPRSAPIPTATRGLCADLKPRGRGDLRPSLPARRASLVSLRLALPLAALRFELDIRGEQKEWSRKAISRCLVSRGVAIRLPPRPNAGAASSLQ
jgi:hypothetical protein